MAALNSCDVPERARIDDNPGRDYFRLCEEIIARGPCSGDATLLMLLEWRNAAAHGWRPI
jgi:hypothetical protein